MKTTQSMPRQPFDHRPYIENRLDRWKVLVLALLFIALLFGALAWPVF